MTRNGRASGQGKGCPRPRPGVLTTLKPAPGRSACGCWRPARQDRAQLAQAMQRGGVPAEAADAILARFTDVGLVDDAAFARAWVESRHHSRGLSKRSLSAELRRHRPSGTRRSARRSTSSTLSRRLRPPGNWSSASWRAPGAATGNPRQAGGGHAGQEGLPARSGLPADQGGHAAGRRRLDEIDADQYLDPDAGDDALARDDLGNHRAHSRRSSWLTPFAPHLHLTSAAPPRTARLGHCSPRRRGRG